MYGEIYLPNMYVYMSQFLHAEGARIIPIKADKFISAGVFFKQTFQSTDEFQALHKMPFKGPVCCKEPSKSGQQLHVIF